MFEFVWYLIHIDEKNDHLNRKYLARQI